MYFYYKAYEYINDKSLTIEVVFDRGSFKRMIAYFVQYSIKLKSLIQRISILFCLQTFIIYSTGIAEPY